jgi:hypothetical protein
LITVKTRAVVFDASSVVVVRPAPTMEIGVLTGGRTLGPTSELKVLDGR